MDVTRYIASEMQKPFRVGETDCANTADRWFKTRCGYSPMERFGRVVRDQRDFDLWLTEPGGMVRGIARVMRHNAVLRASHLVPGDIGIIVVDWRACIAIRDVTQWWSRDTDGYMSVDDSYCRFAWRTPCPQHSDP
jgi:hypothetical protein